VQISLFFAVGWTTATDPPRCLSAIRDDPTIDAAAHLAFRFESLLSDDLRPRPRDRRRCPAPARRRSFENRQTINTGTCRRRGGAQPSATSVRALHAEDWRGRTGGDEFRDRDSWFCAPDHREAIAADLFRAACGRRFSADTLDAGALSIIVGGYADRRMKRGGWQYRRWATGRWENRVSNARMRPLSGQKPAAVIAPCRSGGRRAG